MLVRLLTPVEILQFTSMLNEGGHYPDLALDDLAGTTCFGVFSSKGELIGGAMVIIQSRHAYLDYLYVKADSRNVGAGSRLLDYVHEVLTTHGTKYVYASISGGNELSGKLAARYRGKVGFPFMHVRINLEED